VGPKTIAKNAATRLERNAGAALPDLHRRIGEGLAAVSRLGHHILYTRAATHTLVGVLLIADVERPVRCDARLTRLLIALRRRRGADEERATPGVAAVRGAIALDPVTRGEFAVRGVNNVAVARIDRQVIAVRFCSIGDSLPRRSIVG